MAYVTHKGFSQGKYPYPLEKSYREMIDLKVLEPACGSGSFLIRAYDELVNYFEKKDKQANLFTKFRILTANIYGVDLDAQAVEIAQLNLLLKTLSTKARLPNLAGKIRVGNLLISEDDPIYCEEQIISSVIARDRVPKQSPLLEIATPEPALSDETRLLRLARNDTSEGARNDILQKYFGDNFLEKKPFTYEKEFPDVFNRKNPGFDVIIGNPPYVNMQLLRKEDISYYKDNFSIAKRYFDLFSLFIERSLKLLREGGYFGFIVPSLFLKGMQYEPLRNLINTISSEFRINELGDNVFENVKMPTCIFILKKGVNKKKVDYFGQQVVNIFLADKIISLGNIAVITRGLEIGRDKSNESGKVACITGSDIEPYIIKTVRFISKDILNQFEKSSEIFYAPKILVRETGNAIVAAYDDKGIITTRSLYNVRSKDKNYSLLYILALLNSKPYKYYFRCFIAPDTNIFPKIRVEQTRQIPIYKIDFSNPKEKSKHDELASLADKMLKLNKELQKTHENSDKWYSLKKEIERTDKKIDERVYNLYGVMEKEINIINGVSL